MPEERIVARVDRGKFDRVVMNLVGNAMKYSRHKVSVKLSAGDDGTLVLTISDDGIGINDNERDKIFDTYYQISGDDVGATLGTDSTDIRTPCDACTWGATYLWGISQRVAQCSA